MKPVAAELHMDDDLSDEDSNLESRLRGASSSRLATEVGHEPASRLSSSSGRQKPTRMGERQEDHQTRRPLRGRWPSGDQFEQSHQETRSRAMNNMTRMPYLESKKKRRLARAKPEASRYILSSHKNLSKLSYILISVILLCYLKTTEFDQKPKLLFVGAHENGPQSNHLMAAEQKRPLAPDTIDNEDLGMRVARTAVNGNQLVASGTRGSASARYQASNQAVSPATGEWNKFPLDRS